MKKIIFSSLALIAFLILIFVSCEKDESEKHEYTPEELEEIRRQDSLKNIIPADYIFTIDVTVPISKGYEGTVVTLDSTKLLELFEYASVPELVAALGTLEGGVQAGNEITFYAYNYSTKYEVTNPSTTNYFGHWFDANGDVCNWGDQAYLFCEKVDEVSLDFRIGIFPDRPEVGSLFHIVEAMSYDNYKVAILFNVTIGPEEEAPEAVVVGSETLDLEVVLVAYTASTTEFDNAAVTTAIGLAPEDATLMAVESDNSLNSGSWTATFGYWFNASGDVCNWGDDGCTYYVEYYSDSQTIGVGLYPDAAAVDETYTGRIAFVNEAELKQYNIIVNITIVEPGGNPYPETTLEGTQTLTASADTVRDYSPTPVTVDTAAIVTAIGVGPAGATLYGVNATTDSLYTDGFTANNGCWYNADGDVCSWGDDGAAIAAEYDAAAGIINIYQHGNPEATKSGQKYTVKLAFVNDSKRYVVVVEITMN